MKPAIPCHALPSFINLLQLIATKRILKKTVASRYKELLQTLRNEGLVDFVSDGHTRDVADIHNQRATVTGPGWVCLPAGLTFARIRPNGPKYLVPVPKRTESAAGKSKGALLARRL